MQIRFLGTAAPGQHSEDNRAAHARRRLQACLRQRSACVAHVSVKIGDASGRRAPHDAYCLMRVQLHGAPEATVVDIGADAYEAIDRAADRIGRLAEAQWRSGASPAQGSGRARALRRRPEHPAAAAPPRPRAAPTCRQSCSCRPLPTGSWRPGTPS
ncbi:hypothetical protein [Ramlibacter sp. AN1133]|uniref:hypothetical protein n=1 Tax=Ramlibacter sp. AN1133 TaxID=3133429 RepID=UPI0030BEFCCD